MTLSHTTTTPACPHCLHCVPASAATSERSGHSSHTRGSRLVHHTTPHNYMQTHSRARRSSHGTLLLTTTTAVRRSHRRMRPQLLVRRRAPPGGAAAHPTCSVAGEEACGHAGRKSGRQTHVQEWRLCTHAGHAGLGEGGQPGCQSKGTDCHWHLVLDHWTRWTHAWAE